MTEEMYLTYSKLKTDKGFAIDYAIRSGVMFPHLDIGITNDGIESLNMFKELYDKIVESWHEFPADQNHQSNMNSGDLKPFSISKEIVNKYV